MPRKYTGSKVVHKTRRNPRTGKVEKSEHLYLRFKDPRTGKFVYVSTGTADTDKAEEFREEKMRELRAGTAGIPVPHSKACVAEVLDGYARHMMGEPGAERLSYSMAHLLDFWGDRTLDTVNKETIKEYCVCSQRANGTIKRELTDLRSAINHAVSMQRSTAFQFPEIPVQGRKRERYMTRDEVAKLLWAARKDYRARHTLTLFILIGYYSGARKQAIMQLQWSQIDFAQNTLDFRDPELNTGNKRRSKIPMPPKLRNFLLRRFARYSGQGTFVFHQRHAPERHVKQIDKGFRSAVRRAGLEAVTPHTLRHTRVSEFAQMGEEPINVAAYMAMSLQTIIEVYAHVNNKHVTEMAKRIGRSHKVRTTSEKVEENKEKSGKQEEPAE